jgi:hypothetical protein
MVNLGPWLEQPDASVPRAGHGFCHGMSGDELYASARGWWVVNLERASATTQDPNGIAQEKSAGYSVDGSPSRRSRRVREAMGHAYQGADRANQPGNSTTRL